MIADRAVGLTDAFRRIQSVPWYGEQHLNYFPLPPGLRLIPGYDTWRAGGLSVQ